MSVTEIFLDKYNMRFLEYKDIINYTNWYQISFNQLFNLFNNNSWILKKTIEMTLQSSLFRYFGKKYLVLVLPCIER